MLNGRPWCVDRKPCFRIVAPSPLLPYAVIGKLIASKTRVAVSRSLHDQAGASCRLHRLNLKSPGHAHSGFVLLQVQQVYGTLMVVTLYAGNVSVSDEPLTAIVPMDTGVTGSPAVLCAEAVVAVI